MAQTVNPTGVGVVATDGSTYATLTLLLAAGKTAFPGLEASGLYPRYIVLTSLNSGGTGPGDKFSFDTNVPDGALPSLGVVVENGGQQWIENGLDAQHARPIQNVAIIGKVTAGDIISISAVY